MSFVHQIGLRPGAPTASDCIAGLWAVDEHGRVSINGVRAEPGNTVVPSLRGICDLDNGVSVNDSDMFWPGKLERDAILRVAKATGVAGIAWRQLMNALPVATIGVDESKDLQGVLALLKTGLPALERVSHRPWTHVNPVEHSVRVEQARRISSRFVPYLAAHPSDWAGRMWQRAAPRKVLSVETEEDYALYENRVVVGLVTRLAGYLEDRQGVLELEAEWKRINDESSVVKRTSELWERFQRLVKRVVQETFRSGSSLESDSLAEPISRLSRIKQSHLYMGLRTQAISRGSLEPANLFRHSPDYAQAKALWEHLERLRLDQDADLTEEAHFAAQQALYRDYVSYCAIVIANALKQLGFRSRPATPPDSGKAPTEAHFDHEAYDSWAWVLRPQAGGVLLLAHDRNFIKIVPLFADPRLDHPDAKAFATAIEHSLDRANSERVIVMYLSSIASGVAPGGTRTTTHVKLRSLGNEGMGDPRLMYVPVSARDIWSVERMARALRVALWTDLYSPYPVPVGSSGKQLYHLPISEIRDLESAHKGKVGRSATSEGDLVSLRLANKILQRQFTCPVCEEPVQPRKAARVDRLWLHCDKCGAEWGLHQCAECHQPYPVIHPFLSSEALIASKGQEPGWVDGLMGQDTLAAPCWCDPTGNDYICPKCGNCKNELRNKGSCLRCQAHREIGRSKRS